MIRLFLNLSSIYLSLELKTLLAEVVKLANTLRSGRSGRKSLRVQLPPSANHFHFLKTILRSALFPSAPPSTFGGPCRGIQGINALPWFLGNCYQLLVIKKENTL